MPQASLARIRAAYDEGRYQDAEPALRRLARSSSPEATEAKRLLDELVTRKRVAAGVLLAKARELREHPQGSLERALEYYDLTVGLLDGDAPARIAVADERREVEAIRQQRRRAYRAKVEALGATTGECLPAKQTRGLLELAVMRRELGAGDSLTELAIDAARACFAAQRDVETVALTELALEIGLPGEAVEESAMTRMALAAARLGTTGPRAATRRPARASSEGRRPSPKAIAARAESDVLPRAQALYAAGEVYQALLLLDEAINDVATDEGLRAQRSAWQRERSQLVAVYLDRAEAALATEDPDTAQSWYARVLALDPRHEIALDRMHKIENLHRLRASRTPS